MSSATLETVVQVTPPSVDRSRAVLSKLNFIFGLGRRMLCSPPQNCGRSSRRQSNLPSPPETLSASSRRDYFSMNLRTSKPRIRAEANVCGLQRSPGGPIRRAYRGPLHHSYNGPSPPNWVRIEERRGGIAESVEYSGRDPQTFMLRPR